MLSVICFSKDRPLQLKAYIESLLFHSGVKQHYIHILYKGSQQISYNDLLKEFPFINWIEEKDFFTDLVTLVNKAENYIMFGCDDVAFKSSFSFNKCIKALKVKKDLLCFTLRLGVNIKDLPSLSNLDDFLFWNWTKAHAGHWAYPWEVSGSVYRKETVVDYIKTIEHAANPNYFEDMFYNNSKAAGFKKKLQAEYPFMACFETGKSVTITINRVQDEFANEFDTSKDTTVESLNNYFIKGMRIDWEGFESITNNNVHVGAGFFKLTNQAPPVNKFIGDILPEGQGNSKVIRIGYGIKLKIFFAKIIIPLKEMIRPLLGRKGLKTVKAVFKR